MSKAAAIRFFSDHIGCVFDTRQVRPGRPDWSPGLRTLARRGATSFSLDGSTVEFTPAHRVTEVTDTSVTVEWTAPTDDTDDDGTTGGDGTRVIHTTTYTVAPF